MEASGVASHLHRGYFFWLALQCCTCLALRWDVLERERWALIAVGGMLFGFFFLWQMNTRTRKSKAKILALGYAIGGMAIQKALFVSSSSSMNPAERELSLALAATSKLSLLFFQVPTVELVLLLLVDSLLQLLLLQQQLEAAKNISGGVPLLILTDILFLALPLMLGMFSRNFVPDALDDTAKMRKKSSSHHEDTAPAAAPAAAAAAVLAPPAAATPAASPAVPAAAAAADAAEAAALANKQEPLSNIDQLLLRLMRYPHLSDTLGVLRRQSRKEEEWPSRETGDILHVIPQGLLERLLSMPLTPDLLRQQQNIYERESLPSAPLYANDAMHARSVECSRQTPQHYLSTLPLNAINRHTDPERVVILRASSLGPPRLDEETLFSSVTPSREPAAAVAAAAASALNSSSSRGIAVRPYSPKDSEGEQRFPMGPRQGPLETAESQVDRVRENVLKYLREHGAKVKEEGMRRQCVKDTVPSPLKPLDRNVMRVVIPMTPTPPKSRASSQPPPRRGEVYPKAAPPCRSNVKRDLWVQGDRKDDRGEGLVFDSSIRCNARRGLWDQGERIEDGGVGLVSNDGISKGKASDKGMGTLHSLPCGDKIPPVMRDLGGDDVSEQVANRRALETLLRLALIGQNNGCIDSDLSSRHKNSSLHSRIQQQARDRESTDCQEDLNEQLRALGLLGTPSKNSFVREGRGRGPQPCVRGPPLFANSSSNSCSCTTNDLFPKKALGVQTPASFRVKGRDSVDSLPREYISVIPVKTDGGTLPILDPFACSMPNTRASPQGIYWGRSKAADGNNSNKRDVASCPERRRRTMDDMGVERETDYGVGKDRYIRRSPKVSVHLLGAPEGDNEGGSFTSSWLHTIDTDECIDSRNKEFLDNPSLPVREGVELRPLQGELSEVIDRLREQAMQRRGICKEPLLAESDQRARQNILSCKEMECKEKQVGEESCPSLANNKSEMRGKSPLDEVWGSPVLGGGPDAGDLEAGVFEAGGVKAGGVKAGGPEAGGPGDEGLKTGGLTARDFEVGGILSGGLEPEDMEPRGLEGGGPEATGIESEGPEAEGTGAGGVKAQWGPEEANPRAREEEGEQNNKGGASEGKLEERWLKEVVGEEEDDEDKQERVPVEEWIRQGEEVTRDV